MKPRFKVKAICVFVATPSDEAPALARPAASAGATNSVSAVTAGTAAMPDTSLHGISMAADIFFPNMPEFLQRDGCNVSPFMRAQ